MSDDRKKKLEELKRRNEEAKLKLANMNKPVQVVPVTDNSQSSATPSVNQNQSATNSVDQLIRAAMTKSPADINIEEIKRATSKRLSRYNIDTLGFYKMEQSILGVTPETYEMEVQCDINLSDEGSDLEEKEEKKYKDNGYRRSIVGMKNKKNPFGQSTAKKPIDVKDITEEEVKAVTMFDDESASGTKPKIIVNEEMRRQILNSTELSDFLISKSKYMERTLGEKDIYDTFKTYYDEEDNADTELSKRSWVSPAMDFIDENSTGRAVTSLEFSLKHQELLLAAYSKSDDFNLSQSNGLIQLWSLALRKTPEFTFTCQTEVTSAIFHKFIPKLVIGATYTGQILIWDTRGKSLPVQKTPPGGKFHSHPIYCLGVTGSPNANNIISVSNDGVLCTWSLSNLSKPVKRMELKAKKRKGGEVASSTESKIDKTYNEDIGAICLATQENESNNIFLGSDDSDIYQIYVHQANDSVDNVVETYKKHTGPIHSLNMHPGDYHKTANFSNLMLSASADWSVNLWYKNHTDSPLFTFDASDDYVYDAKFHPTNPSLFACVDGLGNLDFWDINKDHEVPNFRYEVGKNALNKMSWSCDGKRLAVGDNTGKISILNLDKELYNSKVEDSIKFDKIISNAKMNKKGY